VATTRKTITISDQQDAWVKERIASGDYTNDSEYFRDLIRRDQEQNAKFQILKAAIQEGLDTGDSDRTVPQIMEEVELRLKSNGRL
jgi:antitoxin ParD1/3/4